MKPGSLSERSLWLVSRRADFWLACGGASVGLLASILLIFVHGDRELDALDFVLSEFHLGATYGAVVSRRLWHHRRVDLVLIPLVILALTYALSISENTILITSIAMYAAVWHRGRQSFGVARFYQRGMGGPLSHVHDCLFRGAIYLPMVAAVLAYTHLAPTDFEGDPYLALNAGAEMTWFVSVAALGWVTAYLTWALWRKRSGRTLVKTSQGVGIGVHPGESWVVLAHAVAFGTAYVFGASNASFLLVLAVHHEIQYLYFAYAMARRTAGVHALVENATGPDTKELNSETLLSAGRGLPTEARFAAAFLLWPVIGFAGAIFGGSLRLAWMAPLGMGGLFCHYWLDGRIWTRESFKE